MSKILIFEQDPALRGIYHTHIQRKGLEKSVDIVKSQNQFIAHLFSHDTTKKAYQGLVIDVDARDDNRIEQARTLVEQTRHHEQYKNTPIYLTGSRDLEMKIHDKNAAFMSKSDVLPYISTLQQ